MFLVAFIFCSVTGTGHQPKESAGGQLPVPFPPDCEITFMQPIAAVTATTWEGDTVATKHIWEWEGR